MNHHYNKKLQPLARGMRNYGTKAEACIWKYVLRAGMMEGYEFKRQRPILNYIADFFCEKLMLIIEVDGLTHDWEATIEKDKRKQTDLNEAGYHVLRFTDTEVLEDIGNVKRCIEQWIENRRRND